MKRAKLRRARPKPKAKPKRKAPEKTVTLTMKQFRELLEAAKGGRENHPRGNAPRRKDIPARDIPRAQRISRADARKLARERVLGAVLRDFREGKIDEGDVEQMEERRAELIDQAEREILRGPAPTPKCNDCERPSTTVMNGEPYCGTHAKLYKQEYAA